MSNFAKSLSLGGLLLVTLPASALPANSPGPIATQVAAGGSHTCALTTAGAVLCWGSNVSGQLGNNSTTDSHVPMAVSGLGSGVVAIAAGIDHTCALTTAGALLCWGSNQFGQLGNNSTTDSPVPVAVSGLGNGVAAIGAGVFHTCAVTTAGAAQCWGGNGNGELGNNSTTNSLVPVAVSNLTSGVAAIAAGQAHTCALTTAGGAQCWGANFYGELGNNSTMQSLVPVAVSGLTSGVAAITARGDHACALTTAGAAQCWGKNGDGQLGNNSTTSSDAPVTVNGLSSGVVAIAAGQFHTCALTTGGGAQCWGYNGFGQLGNNSTTESHVPVAVSTLTSVVAPITAGGQHTCALTPAGGAVCWGDNFNGQLGNNSTADSHVPVAVSGLGGDVIFVNGFDN